MASRMIPYPGPSLEEIDARVKAEIKQIERMTEMQLSFWDGVGRLADILGKKEIPHE